MSRTRPRVLLLAEGPGAASAAACLEAALRLHGGIDVDRDGDGSVGQDAVILCTSRSPCLDAYEFDGAAPVIVMPNWAPAPEEAAALVAAGADDVLDVAEANPARLAGVIRKAVARAARRDLPRPSAPRAPFATPVAGLVPDGPFSMWGFVETDA
jgi:hypothetical protein